MNLGESFRTALDALNSNKLRSILTMLGVIIGVSAVIALLGLGNGFSASIEGEISAIGSNLLFVSTDFDNSDFPALSLDDIDALNDPSRAPAILAVAGSDATRRDAIANGRDYQATVQGVTSNYFALFNLADAADYAYGSAFSEFDAETRSRVVIVGWDVANQLFEDEFPIGQRVKVDGASYEIIGVFAESEGGIGLNPNDSIYMPLSTFQNRIRTNRTRDGRPAVSDIVASASSSDSSDAAIDQLTQVLREEHGILYASDDDFEIFSQADLLDTIGSILGTATLFVGIVAGISLLVGGIGIMNIMLVSVTERTREIGIRKSLGALRRDILVQFMIESLFLSLIGGVIGIVLGYTFARIGEGFAGFPAQITISSIALAVGFSVAVGLIFGIYPAWRAARLRPIDALRYE